MSNAKTVLLHNSIRSDVNLTPPATRTSGSCSKFPTQLKQKSKQKQKIPKNPIDTQIRQQTPQTNATATRPDITTQRPKQRAVRLTKLCMKYMPKHGVR